MHLQIDLTVRFSSPFTIGTGALAQAAVDRPLVKDARGRPYVPGSVLKGRLRHSCEAVLRTLVADDVVCWSPSAETMCPQVEVRNGPPCLVCQVFGSSWDPGPLVFSDLQLDAARLQVYDAASRTGRRSNVSIDRWRRVAAEDLLYTTEVSDAATIVPLVGSIAGNLPDQEKGPAALLLAGLRNLPALGGSKSRGLGWFAAEVNLKLDDQPVQISVEEVLRQWLNI